MEMTSSSRASQGAAGGGQTPAPESVRLLPPLPPLQGTPGTVSSLLARTVQAVAAAASLAAMLAAADFSTVPSFSFLVAATVVQTVWSFGLAVLDIDMMFISTTKSRNHWFFQLIKFGDMITCVVIFSAASASSGVLIFTLYDLVSCSTEHCTQFKSAITRAFISFAALLASVAANWFAWCGRPAEAVFRSDRLLLIVNAIFVGLAGPTIALGVIIRGLVHVTATGLSIVAVMMQFSACVLEVIGQLIGMYFGTTTPVPDWPLMCVLLVTTKWFLSLWTLGTACASTGTLHLFFTNNSFVRSTTVRGAIYCAVSMTMGALAIVSSCVTTYLAVCRCLRRRGQQ